MIDPVEFLESLKQHDITFFTGVPDSLLASLIRIIGSNSTSVQDSLSANNVSTLSHVVAANEGSAVALASGYHLSTGKIAAVYMQNSGLGNAINPLTSIADPEVYGIPMLLIIGWRGEPGVKDEPQHVKQGAISEDLLKTLGLPYWILDKKSSLADLSEALNKLKSHTGPTAFLVRKNAFTESNISATAAESKDNGAAEVQPAVTSVIDAPSAKSSGEPAVGSKFSAPKAESKERAAAEPYSSVHSRTDAEPELSSRRGEVGSEFPRHAESCQDLPSREDMIASIASSALPDAIFVATTGKIGRELYEFRMKSGNGSERDFYCVGGMGHASQIAMAIAMNRPNPIYCLDGDGAALMHLGHLASIGAISPTNFVHIVLNNRMHESVGGQPTTSPDSGFAELGRVFNYASAWRCSSAAELQEALASFDGTNGPLLVEMLVASGSRADLVRPKETPTERKIAFMKGLGIEDLS